MVIPFLLVQLGLVVIPFLLVQLGSIGGRRLFLVSSVDLDKVGSLRSTVGLWLSLSVVCFMS